MVNDFVGSILATIMATACVGRPVMVRLARHKIYVTVAWHRLKDHQKEALKAVSLFLMTGREMPQDVDDAAGRRIGLFINAVVVVVVVGIVLWGTRR